MISFRNSIATRLALGYGLLVVSSVTLVSAVFYFATIGVLDASIDAQIATLSQRLSNTYRARPLTELLQDIDQQLVDGTDSDSEIFVVLGPSGERIAGNLSQWTGAMQPLEQLLTGSIKRTEPASNLRFMITALDDGRRLVVGRDLSQQDAIRDLVLRGLGIGALAALMLVIGGAIYFRRQLETRIGAIRRAARDIEQGDFSRRIVIAGDDEFEHLNADINRMLDRIQQLMDGVRHVSNSIAHDLRTPLTRIRNQLEDAILRQPAPAQLRESLLSTIQSVDDLLVLFNKLLQIAEVESGMRTRFVEAVMLDALARDLYELYDATAEETGVDLHLGPCKSVSVPGDRDLLASALASLLDNAIKYAGVGAAVSIEVQSDATHAYLVVRDNGSGIPEAELSRVCERFYRLDCSRSKPGNGMGLAIVSAIATLHGGSLLLRNAHPGLHATLRLPSPNVIGLSD